MSSEPRAWTRWLLPQLLVLLVGSGCSEPFEKRTPNKSPVTTLTSGPPDSTSATSYRVHFFWSGVDSDGSVDHFEYIMVDHPAAHDDIGPGGENPVVIIVPSANDPRWTATLAMDSVFVTLADTLRRDPNPGPGEAPEDVREAFFERWHTFFIRAVDDRGLPDPTPDYRSFNARTLAPIIALAPPLQPATYFESPTALHVRWDGWDPIDAFESQAPDSSRWVVIPSLFDLWHEPNRYVSFPESLYTLPSRFQWSPWRAWDAADGSGRQATLTDLATQGEFPNSGFYIVAVQAKDEAGAVTPVFDWETPSKNNVALLRVSGAVGPTLYLHESRLGTGTFVHTSRPVRIEAVGDQPLHFNWSADASRYGGRVDAYRFAWDLEDPAAPDAWDQDWSPNAVSTQRTFPDGVHSLHVQGRDDLGFTVSVRVEVDVRDQARTRALLLVDDADAQSVEDEQSTDARWLKVLSQLAAEYGMDFDPSQDVFDVIEHRGSPPSFEKLLNYSVVLWNNRSGQNQTSALRNLALFHDPYVYRNYNSMRNFNYLKAYVESGGGLWICGFRVAKQLWPVERSRGNVTGPVNVTNWDDPIEPHPLVDSVGTTSLLYKLGVEVFDVGSGLDSPRNALGQFCQGLRTETVDAPVLHTDPARWPQPPSLHGRSNIEIYNVPLGLSTQYPPTAPPAWRSKVLYSFISGVPRGVGVGFPHTADGQPVLIVTRRHSEDAHASHAFAGFEPHLLTLESHIELVRHVLFVELGLAGSSDL